MTQKVIGPASKPQELFLTLRDGTGPRSKWANEDGEEVDIIVYGERGHRDIDNLFLP